MLAKNRALPFGSALQTRYVRLDQTTVTIAIGNGLELDSEVWKNET